MSLHKKKASSCIDPCWEPSCIGLKPGVVPGGEARVTAGRSSRLPCKLPCFSKVCDRLETSLLWIATFSWSPCSTGVKASVRFMHRPWATPRRERPTRGVELKPHRPRDHFSVGGTGIDQTPPFQPLTIDDLPFPLRSPWSSAW